MILLKKSIPLKPLSMRNKYELLYLNSGEKTTRSNQIKAINSQDKREKEKSVFPDQKNISSYISFFH